ncbi:MAG: ABC transporter permease [Spirochaetae bacterium HGW-Spirochaetae-8]|nr:MAG: ABC transporter permease [Spirochaetes bacterium GWC2_52_13]PKL10852.1 MAG: ABC transporter permease [Spirochaetae bacterium HGW-Spirochaetae-8]HCG63292.1 ABC transporter permease [Sphaerochaeta sp.]HCS36624.1 ABC transporter permease [Sphaerochaeta sp.]
MMDFITKLLAATIAMGTSLTYATLGEIYTEKTGILNLGMEGTMLMGALAGFATAMATANLYLALLVAMLIGGLLSAIHAFLCVTMRANQVVSGLAITMFGTGLANFLGQRLGPASNNYNLVGMNLPSKFDNIAIPFLKDIPILGAFFDVSVLTYALYIIIPFSWYYMYKTKYGLAIRAVGESPKTATAMGLSVPRLRYLYTIIGGMFAGLGGACLSLSFTPSWNDGMTGGKGWIVIALVIFATWNPGKAVIGTLVFGGITSLQFSLQAAGVKMVIPTQFLAFAPYLITFFTLSAMTILNQNRKGSFAAPSALGTSFAIDDK